MINIVTHHAGVDNLTEVNMLDSCARSFRDTSLHAVERKTYFFGDIYDPPMTGDKLQNTSFVTLFLGIVKKAIIRRK